MAGEARISISEADYVSASKAAFRWYIRQPRHLWSNAIALGIVIVGAFVVNGSNHGGWLGGVKLALMACGVGLAFLAVVLGFAYVATPRRARRMFAQQPGCREPYDLRWDDSRFEMTSPSWSSALAWKDYYGWSETGNEFLLFFNEQMPHMLPKRLLTADQLADLRATLVEHGPKRR